MKGIGALTLLLTGLGLGMTARHTLEKRIRLLSLFERFLRCVADRIRYTAMPIAELFRLIAETAEFSDFSLLKDTVAKLPLDGEFRAVWRSVVAEKHREWALSEREIALFADFADGLGTSDVTGEIRYCEGYAELVRECLNRRKEEMRAKGGLYIALGICGGSAAALMLW